MLEFWNYTLHQIPEIQEPIEIPQINARRFFEARS